MKYWNENITVFNWNPNMVIALSEMKQAWLNIIVDCSSIKDWIKKQLSINLQTIVFYEPTTEERLKDLDESIDKLQKELESKWIKDMMKTIQDTIDNLVKELEQK